MTARSISPTLSPTRPHSTCQCTLRVRTACKVPYFYRTQIQSATCKAPAHTPPNTRAVVVDARSRPHVFITLEENSKSQTRCILTGVRSCWLKTNRITARLAYVTHLYHGPIGMRHPLVSMNVIEQERRTHGPIPAEECVGDRHVFRHHSLTPYGVVSDSAH